MTGIKETKEVVRFGCAILNACGKSMQNGQIDLKDIYHFLGVYRLANDALQGIEKVPAELKDLDQKELETIKTLIISEFDIPQEEAEQFIESGLKIAFEIARFFLKK